MGTVSAEGRTVRILIRRRNFPLSRSMVLVVPTDLHWDGTAPELPLRHRGFAACLHLSGPMDMDHVPVIGPQFLMQALGSMSQHVAV